MDFQSWLPKSALLDGHLDREVARVAAAWLENWFPVRTDLTVLLSLALNEKETAETSVFWRSQSGDLGFFLSEEGRRVFFAQATGIALGKKRLSEQDDALLDRLLVRSLAAFRPMLAGLFGCRIGPDEPLALARGLKALPSDGGYVFSVLLLPSTPLVHILVPQDLAIRARKAHLPRVSQSLVVDARRRALARLEINVGAFVGEASLAIGDLQGLSSGDILILDQPIDACALMTVNGSPVRDRVCRISASADRAVLEITDGTGDACVQA